ncbi:MAG: hypothetical protein CM1200mP30_27810 [Pseudomonadota bacterium]|nr:MAG: hypothetical protein CM1200mP30_27810 [Pseudomonadota bacterium]
MKRVTRQEILDYVTYEEQRKQIREKIMNIKELRRINVAGVLSFSRLKTLNSTLSNSGND